MQNHTASNLEVPSIKRLPSQLIPLLFGVVICILEFLNPVEYDAWAGAAVKIKLLTTKIRVINPILKNLRTFILVIPPVRKNLHSTLQVLLM
ncbi:hypothetical protein ASZ90_018137 [hydrocarbon metagenome]|uniref:Uncharacterized protein n=1 Tax=hydrocarbon metagenome TaxID=938273 RepID=A0A0W8E754_9ZZZZ